MRDTQTLTRHRDIRAWVTGRQGSPAIARVRDNYGSLKARLCLRFNAISRPQGTTPSVEDGMSPVSWSAWLAELDRQQLALKVTNQDGPGFELVERNARN
jgi:hypothetical protein